MIFFILVWLYAQYFGLNCLVICLKFYNFIDIWRATAKITLYSSLAVGYSHFF